MSYRRTYLAGHVLQEDVCYWRKCHLKSGHVLSEDIVYCRICLIRGHVFQVEMSFRMTCLKEVHVLVEDMSNMSCKRTYFSGGCIFQEDIS